MLIRLAYRAGFRQGRRHGLIIAGLAATGVALVYLLARLAAIVAAIGGI